MKETEKHIQRAILEWGQYKRILMHRINVIGTPLHKDGLTVYRPSRNKGMADIHATLILAGIPISVWLEVKTKRGKLSPNQLLFKDSVEAFGGFYYVVRSIDDVESAVDEVKLKSMGNIRSFLVRHKIVQN